MASALGRALSASAQREAGDGRRQAAHTLTLACALHGSPHGSHHSCQHIIAALLLGPAQRPAICCQDGSICVGATAVHSNAQSHPEWEPTGFGVLEKGTRPRPEAGASGAAALESTPIMQHALLSLAPLQSGLLHDLAFSGEQPSPQASPPLRFAPFQSKQALSLYHSVKASVAMLRGGDGFAAACVCGSSATATAAANAAVAQPKAQAQARAPSPTAKGCVHAAPLRALLSRRACSCLPNPPACSEAWRALQPAPGQALLAAPVPALLVAAAAVPKRMWRS